VPAPGQLRERIAEAAQKERNVLILGPDDMNRPPCD
jgi:hypothetical protein